MKNNTPCRLHKVKDNTTFDEVCATIAPYVVVVAIVVFVALTLFIMVKYGGVWFGTEANRYYYGGL